MKILAGDVGGTNTRLILADIQHDGWQILAENNYASQSFDGLVAVVSQFLESMDIQELPDAACFAVAGPVKNQAASVTNLPWQISEQQLAAELKITSVLLINDYIAAAYGVPLLKDEDIIHVQKPVSGNNKTQARSVILGAGTGLGASHRVWCHGGYIACASEAGHSGFSPGNTMQEELLAWMRKQHSHVSLEMLLSGKGLGRIYSFLHEEKKLPESAEVAEGMKHTDPAQIITTMGLSGKDMLCEQTLDCFVQIYGAAAGDIALHYYPLDEVYISGGIAPKIKDKICSADFLDAFTNKGLMSSNMKEISIKLVCNDKLGLYGALLYAMSCFEGKD